MKHIIALIFGFALSACISSKVNELYEPKAITGPKIVALSGPRYPWTTEIERRLRDRGYKVLRFASMSNVTERQSANRIESYRESTSRVVLIVNGHAPSNAMMRCFAGGYVFDYVSAEVIDTVRNQTLATYSNSGYSENCAPFSGRIFGDIADMVDDVFAN